MLRPMADTADASRRVRILEGATSVFLAYGFQRTTMDDIARAAEISRPALYLLFRNKTDIYRALASEFLDRAMEAAGEALARDGELSHRLGEAVSCTLGLMREIEDSPHGAEILDMKNSLAADIVAEGRARFGGLIAAAIRAECGKSGGAGAPDVADSLADLLLDALDGMKLRGLPAEQQIARSTFYVDAVARLTRP